jgi:uncharacterized protein
MSENPLTTPLAEADYARLELLLRRVNPDAMGLEELDGFFCALVCGPSKEPMTVYFPDVLGLDLNDDRAGYSLVDPQELSTLLVRLWNEIAATQLAGKPYIPLFSNDAEGNPDGHDWAAGFAEGMDMDPEDWDRMIKNKDHWVTVAPMMFLLAEYDPDLPDDMKVPPFPQEKRIELLGTTSACLSQIFMFFHGDSGKRKSKRK